MITTTSSTPSPESTQLRMPRFVSIINLAMKVSSALGINEIGRNPSPLGSIVTPVKGVAGVPVNGVDGNGAAGKNAGLETRGLEIISAVTSMFGMRSVSSAVWPWRTRPKRNVSRAIASQVEKNTPNSKKTIRYFISDLALVPFANRVPSLGTWRKRR